MPLRITRRRTSSAAGDKIWVIQQSRLKNKRYPVVAVNTINRYKLNAEIVASIQISVERNQSLISPRSSINCNVPTAMLSVAKPNMSKGARVLPGSLDKDEHAERAQGSDGRLMSRPPARAEIVGQPAAKGRTDDEAHRRAGGEDCHRVTVTLTRIDGIEGRLTERHKSGAAYPLQHAEERQLGAARRGAAQSPRQG